MKKQSLSRSLVAIVLAIAAMLVSMVVLGFPASLIQSVNEPASLVVYTLLHNAVVITCVWFIIRRFLKDSPAAYGLGRPGPGWVWPLVGLALPLATLLLVSLVLPGHWGPLGTEYDAVDTVAYLIIYTGFFGSVVEEVVYHGVMYPLLRQRLGVLASAVITGVVFALSHMANPNDWTAAGMAVFFLVSTCMSVALGYVTEYTGSVWAAACLHVLWNIMTVGFLNIGTEARPDYLLNYVVEHDVPLLTGSTGGLTASLMVVPVMVGLIACVLLTARRRGGLVPRGPRAVEEV